MRRFITLLTVLLLSVALFGCQFANFNETDEPVFAETLNSQTTVETQQTEISSDPTETATSEETLPETSAEILTPEIVLPEPDDNDFVRIVDYIPTAKIDLRYATENNFTGKVIYNFTEAYLRYGTLKKLMKANEELADHGLGLIIWDGFRPEYGQAKLWEACPNPKFVSRPNTGRRTHCRGNTLDLSVYDLATGEDVPVPTDFDDFSAKADRNYSDCSPDAAKNARILEQAMKKQGFIPYSAEWWHFEDKVSYPIEKNFNPADLIAN